MRRVQREGAKGQQPASVRVSYWRLKVSLFMTPNTPQDHTPIGAGPAGLIRRLDRIFLTLILALLALHFWGEAPRISLTVIVAAISVMVARLVIEHRSGLPRKETGATTAAWLFPISIAFALWLFPVGSDRTHATVVLAFVLALGAVHFFRWRAASAGRQGRPT